MTLFIILGSITLLCTVYLYMLSRYYHRQMIYYRAEMFNERKVLERVRHGLATFVENEGGVWCDHGTDDYDLICFHHRGFDIAISLRCWGIDGEEVDFYTLLTMLSKV